MLQPVLGRCGVRRLRVLPEPLLLEDGYAHDERVYGSHVVCEAHAAVAAVASAAVASLAFAATALALAAAASRPSAVAAVPTVSSAMVQLIRRFDSHGGGRTYDERRQPLGSDSGRVLQPVLGRCGVCRVCLLLGPLLLERGSAHDKRLREQDSLYQAHAAVSPTEPAVAATSVGTSTVSASSVASSALAATHPSCPPLA